ncbi:MAG: hypothetical protein QNJ36_05535 [Calothrix sp. MO_167.B42]|nr:hypothetical protein [Calothrix sp. MO_167.B42]
MAVSLLKNVLPDHALPLPILSGPFRGATIKLNPRCSLRKIFGLYEHELNSWLGQVLAYVNIVLDVGANDGYFTFGCAAAFHRLNKSAQIIAFEPLSNHFEDLQSTLEKYPQEQVKFHLHKCLVGSEVNPGVMTTLRCN